ncbi:MAG TPA: D-amino acid dehydrogenase [Burkholderiales bacterium]|nr:D-amino acid dehydrogenase [Burkholderiales bacterium]
MKIVILGSGVIGVSSAYYLAKLGHQIVVLDRRQEPALETSFANAGEVSPGYSAPWASPGLPLKALKWLFMKHSPLVIRFKLDPAMWSWGIQLLRNCTTARYDINKSRMLRLAEYSRDCLRALRAETGIQYDQRMQGTLQLFRTQRQVDNAASDIAILDRYGVPYQVLDRDGCIDAEPALSQVKDKITGGLRLPDDETGDCFKFTQSLAKIAQNLGVDFRFGANIHGLRFSGQRITHVALSNGDLTADAFIVALGSFSPLLLKPLGIRIPVYPVKGYSLTLPIVNPSGAPESTVMDETFKVAVTRLGDRIRVGGTAELTGYDLQLRERQRKTLEHVVSDLFAKGGDMSKAIFWTGLRPMTPDGPPILGRTPYANLFINTGHGTLGWTMAAGSGRVIADVVSGRYAEIDLAGLTLNRYDRFS